MHEEARAQSAPIPHRSSHSDTAWSSSRSWPFGRASLGSTSLACITAANPIQPLFKRTLSTASPYCSEAPQLAKRTCLAVRSVNGRFPCAEVSSPRNAISSTAASDSEDSLFFVALGLKSSEPELLDVRAPAPRRARRAEQPSAGAAFSGRRLDAPPHSTPIAPRSSAPYSRPTHDLLFVDHDIVRPSILSPSWSLGIRPIGTRSSVVGNYEMDRAA